MPLRKGKGRATITKNIGEMVKAGHPVKQAVAAAYREAGEKREPKRERPDADDRPKKRPYNIYI